MKTLFARKTSFIILFAAAIGVCLNGQAQTTILKSDTATMNTAADWSGTAPDLTTIGQFDTTISAPNAASLLLGGNVSLAGLQFLPMNGSATIGAGNTLTLGNSGIDMLSASQNVALNCNLSLVPGKQSWGVGGGLTLTLGGNLNRTGAVVDFTSFGGTLVGLSNTNEILGPWALAGGASQYATVTGGLVSGYSGLATTTAADVIDTTGTTNYEVFAVGTVGPGASFNTLRYSGSAGTIAGDFTANGILSIASLTFSSGITVGATKELVIVSPASSYTFTGPISGSSDSAITVYSPTAASQVNLGGTTAGAQMANFLGTIRFGNSTCVFKLRNDSGPQVDKGMSNAIVDLGTATVTMQYKSTAGSGANSGSVTNSFGMLLGGAGTILDVGDSSGGSAFTYTYKVGSRNVDGKFDGLIRNTGGRGTAAIIKTGTGTWTLARTNNSYGGRTVISGGILSAGWLTNGGVVSSIGNSANAAANLILDGGTLQFAGTNLPAISDRLFTLTQNGGTIDASGAGTLSLNGNGANLVALTGIGNRTLTLSGANTGANTLAPVLSDAPGNVTSLAKTGPGQWVLTGINTYSGVTTVGNGVLVLSGNGSIANSTNITVAQSATLDVSAVSFALNGNASLFNSGTVSGSVNTASGSGIYAGTDGGFGTNTISGNLTFASGASSYLDLGAFSAGPNDLISVGGAVILNNTAFHLKAPNTSVSLDTTTDYVLITAANISGTVSSTPVWDVAPANAANFSVIISGNTVRLHFSAAAPPSGTGSANPSSLARGQATTLSVTVTPGSNPISTVVVNASTVGGASSVSLVSTGVGNVYTNTVVVGANAPGGDQFLPVTITDTGALTGNATITVNVLPGNVVWNGGSPSDDNWTTTANWVGGVAPQTFDNVTFAGLNRLTPNLDNSYSLNSLSFDNTAGSFVIGTANGSGLTLVGGITNNSANAETLNVPVALTSTQAISTASGNLTISGPVSGTLGLTKVGNNTLTLSATNVYTGDTTIAAGILQIGDAGQLNNGAYAGSILNNGALVFSSTSTQLLSGIISGPGAVTNSAGSLRLGGANSYSGGAVVNGTGFLSLPTASSAGTGPIVLSSGGTLSPAATFTNPVVVDGNVNISSTGAGFNGTFTGTGTININITGGGIFNLGNTVSGAQFAGFTGTISLGNSDGILKTRNDSGPLTDKNFSQVVLDLGTNTLLLQSKATGGAGANSGSVTQTIGALVGGENTIVDAADTSGITTTFTYNVGGLNTDFTFDGLIRNQRATTAIVKSGTGTWTLTHANTYTGSTTISNGVLALSTNSLGADASIASSAFIRPAGPGVLSVTNLTTGTLELGSQTLEGSGTVVGNVHVGSGTLGAGFSTNSFGNLTILGTVVVDNVVQLDVGHIGTVASDKITCTNITVNGVINVNQLGTNDLITGDTFQLFSGPITGPSAAFPNLPAQNVDGSVTYVWENRLAIDGSIKLTSGGTTSVNPNPGPIQVSVTGNSLTLSWPTNGGWTLQQQTNSLTNPNWIDVPGSTGTTSTNIIIDPTVPQIFYRLKL